jgi:hypothetical protein
VRADESPNLSMSRVGELGMRNAECGIKKTTQLIPNSEFPNPNSVPDTLLKEAPAVPSPPPEG